MEALKIYHNYTVSREGVVKNKNNRALKTHIDKYGYEKITLSINGKKKHKYIHRIVAECFLPNDENKKTVNHKDGNKRNNIVDNLEWSTHSQNIKHAFNNGLKKPSTHTPSAIINLETANLIRVKRTNGVDVRQLCVEFGLKQGAIYKILSNRSWQ